MGNQAFATEDAIDIVPAATLLLPYFEVDLANPQGVTTLFSVNNASAAPQLAHITLWTDMSRPTLDFTIYLTGYDVQTFNLGPLFRTGTLPLLEGPKPTNAGPINGVDENAGSFSIATGPTVDTAEQGCTFPLPPNIPPAFLDYIRSVHTGGPIPAGFPNAGACAGTIGGGSLSSSAGVQDNLARGYLTVDVVRLCDQLVPSDPAYYTNQILRTGPEANVIWGDFFIVNSQENFAQGENLVHIETYGESRDTGTANTVYTFYGRYNVDGVGLPLPYSGQDNREPLATTWGVRYLAGGIFTGGTDLLCWRDNGNRNSRDPFSCVTRNSNDGQPLSQNQVVIFDEEENPVTVPGSPFSPPQQQAGLTICPWEATRTKVDGPRLPTPFDFGWLYLNLNTTVAQGDFRVNGLGIHQSWVGAVMSASARFSVGFQGMHFDLANDPLNVCIGPDGSISSPPCPN
jgi:hypothetical protein